MSSVALSMETNAARRTRNDTASLSQIISFGVLLAMSDRDYLPWGRLNRYRSGGARRCLSCTQGDDNERQIVVLFGVADPVPHRVGKSHRNLVRRGTDGGTQHLLQPLFAKVLACRI